MKKAICFVLLIVLLAVPTFGANVKGNDKNNKYSELLAERANDEVFQKELRESPETAYQMLDQILEERKSISVKSGSYGEASCYVPSIMQVETWYCGYATTLQTLYGLGLQSTVAGSDDNEKQYKIASDMLDPSHSAVVDTIKIYINKRLSTSKYIYANVINSGWTQLTFQNEVAGSLMVNRPVILHAKTLSLSYYNGKDLSHYLSVDYINNYTNQVRIKDCNYDSTYFGSHTVPTAEAFGTVNRADRWMIYN